MKLLAIDTSMQNLSLAVSDNCDVLTYRNVQVKRALSSYIIPTIEKVLKKAKLPLSKIDGFAVGLGPGSFTSLRVGLSTVKSLAFSTKKPVIGVPSLDVIAANANTDGVDHICVISDAKRKLVYAAFYDRKGSDFKRRGKYLLTDIEEVISQVKDMTLFIGDGIENFGDRIKKNKFVLFDKKKKWYPQAKTLAKLAYTRFKEKDFDDVHSLVPLYLYPKDCQVVKK